MSVPGPEESKNVRPLETHKSSGSSGWLAWIIVLGLVGGGVWYYRKNFADTSANNSSPSTGKAGGKRGGGRVPVGVAMASHGDMPIYLRGIGSVAALSTVTVRSRVDGQLLSVAFTEGQFVKEGDLLAQIDPRPFQVQLEQAEAQQSRDKAQLADVQLNYERYKALYKEQVIAKQQLDTQFSQVGVVEGSIKADQALIDNAKLQLVYCRILSPISGRVGLRLVDPGNIVHASDPNGMLVITQMQPIAVLFNLPQESLPTVYKKLRNNQTMVVEAYDSGNTTKIATGKLLTIDNQIDPSTGTYKLKAQFDNDNHALFPNQFINIRMLVDTQHGLTIVPAAAIQRGPNGTYVYKVESRQDGGSPDGKGEGKSEAKADGKDGKSEGGGGGQRARVQPVTVAMTEGETSGISEGLDAGQVVVIDGMEKLQDNSSIETGGGRGAAGGMGGGPNKGSGEGKMGATGKSGRGKRGGATAE